MLNADIRDHAYQFFIEEAPELLGVIEGTLLNLRQERTAGQVHEMMRAAHSIKGGAASVELPAIQELAHRLEDIFKALYNEAVVVDDTLEGYLLDAFDCLKGALMTQIETGSLDHDATLAQALPLILAIEDQLGEYLAAGEQYLPSSADLGVDIVSSLFEVDIVQGLDQLEAALATGDASSVQETLQGQTEVFAGLAELLNLSGFKAITELVQQGLAQGTDTMALASLALQDWRGSCEQVLQNGDRQRGGEPSEGLVALVGNGEVGNWELGSEENIFAGMEFPELGSEENVFAGMEFPELGSEENVFAGMEFPELGNGELGFGDLGSEENVFAGMEFPELEPVAPAVESFAPVETVETPESAETSRQFPPEVINTNDPPYRFFVEEAPELLQAIEEGLLTLRQDRSASKIHGIMRAAHSLKGGAASVGLNGIKEIAHRLEDIFKAFYNEEVILDETLETHLLDAYDGLKNPLEQQISTGTYDPNGAWATVEPVIAAIETQLGDRLREGDSFMPSSADLGVDIVASLFEVDIQQGLDQIRQAQASGNPTQLRETLMAQTEVFLGLAEILNLPGFKAIGEGVQQALQVNPDQLSAITTQALMDWDNSCVQVLQNGDRQRGGNASPQLLALGVKEEKEALGTVQEKPKALKDLFFGDDDEEEETQESPEVETVAEVLEIPELTLEALDNLDALIAPILGDEALAAEAGDGDAATVLENPITPVEIPAPPPAFGGLTPDSQQADLFALPDTELSPATSAPDLTAIVASVEAAFNQLPPAEAPTPQPPIPQSQPETPAPKSTTAPPTPATPSLSIRVDFERLERMNNWVGELAINRNSLSLQNQQLQSAVRSLLTRFGRFQGMTNQLRNLADQLVIMPDAEGSIRARREQIAWISNAFDSLEMDSYGALSGKLQEILEEMMQLEEAVDDIVLFARASNQSLDAQRQMLFSLRDELMWARMLPLGEILNRFPRVLRDMSTKFKKPVQLKVHGTAVLVDRLALEKLYDPLLHLLRNAFDHGIESLDQRRSAGKPDTGTIEIHAHHQGNQTIIEIRDDGGGLNVDKIRQRAIDRQLITPEQAQRLTPDQIQNLIFEPNFSTADQVSELSGRGVGLDVVRQQIQALKGNIIVSSRPGKGTTFSLRLPLTLTIAKLLVCLIGQGQAAQTPLTAIAIPSDSVADLLVPSPNQIKTSGGQRFLLWQHRTVPIYPLHQLLPYQCPVSERQASKLLTSVPQPEDGQLPMVLLQLGEQHYALEVNRLVTEQELVIKPFAPVLQAPNYLYGSTILADGTLIPVVNGALLLEWHWNQGRDTLAAYEAPPEGLTTPEATTPLILVVDDSAALRRTLAFTLEKSGYRVLQAKDGQEALKTLGQTTGINLVICDVEMPNLNGFEFLGQRRRNPDLVKIPVAMLTSRGSDKHRQLAMTLGASAYFTKPYIEQQFLQAVKDLLAGQLVTA